MKTTPNDSEEPARRYKRYVGLALVLAPGCGGDRFADTDGTSGTDATATEGSTTTAAGSGISSDASSTDDGGTTVLDSNDSGNTSVDDGSAGDGSASSGVESTDDSTTTASDSTDDGGMSACGDGVAERGEQCDDGPNNGDGISSCTSTCATNTCGDGYSHTLTEECDEGMNNGPLPATCTSACKDQHPVLGLGAGLAHTCVLVSTGAVRCWGAPFDGQLGYANEVVIGDDETPATAGNVDVGGPVEELALGWNHTCARLGTGTVRCWGAATSGQLGYGNTEYIGDNETPASAGDVDVGGTVVHLTAGGSHNCALLDTGAVRCWGIGYHGVLGYGNIETIGNDEAPASAGDVDIGGLVVELVAGGVHTCALLDTGTVRCWGWGSDVPLGYGNMEDVGDDETPASLGDLDVGGTVVQLAAGVSHTCARLDTGAVRCWGAGFVGQLGYGNTEWIGDDETPASAGDVDIGGIAVEIAAGPAASHTCARLDTGAVRCWGDGLFGQLGYGNASYIGDDETPAAAGEVDVGGTVAQLVLAASHTCARLNTGAVRCWGDGSVGRLGYGNTDWIGDDESPSSAGDVPLF